MIRNWINWWFASKHRIFTMNQIEVHYLEEGLYFLMVRPKPNCSEQLSGNHFERKVTRNWTIYCIQPIMKSMRKRCNAVIAANEGHTWYQCE